MTTEHATSHMPEGNTDISPAGADPSHVDGGSAESERRPMRRLLLVAPGRNARSDVVQYLLRKGFAVSTATRAETVLTLTHHSTGYDLLLLDLTDQPDAARLLGKLQSARPDAGCLLIISRADLEERRGVEWSADDFIVEPFSLRELELRVEAVLRRRGAASHPSRASVVIGGLTIDFRVRSCYRDGKQVGLTSREFDLLACLVRNRGRTVSREALVERVWKTPQAISLRTIDRYITTIRRKIEDDPASPVYLQTIYGEGYRFIADGRASPEASGRP